MKIVIFGLSISSSWGNGHATIWRGLCRALSKRGHQIFFYERDVPYYASQRDLTELPGTEIIIYPEWTDISKSALRNLSDADIGIVTSYCFDAVQACELLLSSQAEFKIFYDLDTPVTLKEMDERKKVNYIPPLGFSEFDFVLSYTGGVALEQLKTKLGARFTYPLYGSVDPETHFPVSEKYFYASDLSYLGTYAQDRQKKLNELFFNPAVKLPSKKFLLGGSQYPAEMSRQKNIFYLSHVPPQDHPSFYCSSSFTLNITRGAMLEMGYCPSGRLFEAAACCVPILSDYWEGFELFFNPGSEIIITKSEYDIIDAINISEAERKKIALNAQERVLSEHTAEHRAIEFENIVNNFSTSRRLRKDVICGE